MNITETNEEGLRRQLKVVVGADELERRLSARLDELKDRVKLRGFRPGHVPKAHLRKVYGRSVMAEVVQQAVADTSREAITQRQERPAFQPTIALPEDETEIDKIFTGSADLAYTMSFEVLPKFDVMDFSKIEVEKPTAGVAQTDIDTSLERLAAANPRYAPKESAATDGDRLTIDFKGTIGGEPFSGGNAEDAQVMLGGRNFIPGFEEGLADAKAGEERVVEATFPEHYPEASLAGKQARFDIKIKEVASSETPALDEAFATGLGFDSLEVLRGTVKQRLEQDRVAASRLKLKRALLDKLNATYTFDLPPTLVDNEFQAIWGKVTGDLERAKRSFEDEGTTEEKARAEYQDIAARRVRLGLILSEVGTRNKIEVTDDEVNRALLERIKQFPGQERKVYDFYRSNPQMLTELRAPIFEDKVIDFITELAHVREKPVTAEELYADVDGAGGLERHHHDHDHEHDHHDHGHHHHDHDHHHDRDHDHRNE